jgi:hypothetical protein
MLGYRTKMSNKKKFDTNFLVDGKPNENFKNKIIESAKTASRDKIREFRQKGIACFSEKEDDILMWAHYSDGHRGFCLEYDTNYEPFQKVHQVVYSASFPTINPADVLLGRLLNIPITHLTTKSEHWSYEKEWRVISDEGDKEFGISVSALTGIYFGCAMPCVHKEVIAMILAGSPTKLYEMKRSETEFRVVFELCTYTPAECIR